MPRTTLTTQIMKYLRSQGCFVVKWHGTVYGVGGMPDIYAVVPPWFIPSLYGRAISLHIEVKAPGKYPTPRQRKVLHDLRAVGAVAFWTTTLDDVKVAVAALWEVGHVVVDEKSQQVCRPQRP